MKPQTPRARALARPIPKAGILLWITLLAAAALVAGAAQALAHDGPGTHPRSGHLDHRPLPTCEASRVLARIVDKAAYQGAVPHQHPVAITGFDHVRQTRHVGALGPGLRERRWCEARAHLADGRSRTVYYVVEGFAGFAGIRYGVESCMAGRDLWNIHGSDCSALRIW